ncbi:MBL fold metallo-hydrolase [Pelomyxa schiedti]|nr:MBL fold metallo-hydrolase [Pelomyxa schiedti]
MHVKYIAALAFVCGMVSVSVWPIVWRGVSVMRGGGARAGDGDGDGAGRILAPEDLARHSEEFVVKIELQVIDYVGFTCKQVIRVTDGVYSAVGFSLANSILLVGDTGTVVVDTTEAVESAREIRAAFSEIVNFTEKPLKAIIYTHNHQDHVLGTSVFLEGFNPKPAIYSHAETYDKMAHWVGATQATYYKRGMRQFGAILPPHLQVNAGIGKELMLKPHSATPVVFPDHLFEGEEYIIEICGMQLVLKHCPGETPDQIVVWLPQKKVLIPADNFYKSFPNLYAIRGTMYRDVLLWEESMDIMLQYKAEHLVPWSENVTRVLTHYRDAIKYVHDQTAYWMNRGKSTNQISELVHLPPVLQAAPELQQFYGEVSSAARAIFAGYLGWFDGNPTHLRPLPEWQHSMKMLALMGGTQNVALAAKDALQAGEYQWAMELADLIQQAKDVPTALLSQIRDIKSECLLKLAAQESNAPYRNYYTTYALEMRNEIDMPDAPKNALDIFLALSPNDLFYMIECNLNAEKSVDVFKSMLFSFPDISEHVLLEIRGGVALHHTYKIPPDLNDMDIAVRLDYSTLAKLLTKDINPVSAYLTRKIKVEKGTIAEFGSLMALFQVNNDMEPLI